MTEIWKDIRGYEKIYQVSTEGNVRRILSEKSNKNQTRSRKFWRNYKGYLNVRLHKEGVGKRYFVHRLVAETFIPNAYPERIFVNHINHCRDDNRLENLEWVTNQMNLERRLLGHRRSVSKQPTQRPHSTFHQCDKS